MFVTHWSVTSPIMPMDAILIQMHSQMSLLPLKTLPQSGTSFHEEPLLYHPEKYHYHFTCTSIKQNFSSSKVFRCQPSYECWLICKKLLLWNGWKMRYTCCTSTIDVNTVPCRQYLDDRLERRCWKCGPTDMALERRKVQPVANKVDVAVLKLRLKEPAIGTAMYRSSSSNFALLRKAGSRSLLSIVRRI